uniref:Ig-like domain-containing protein n=1 Tax=Romanomermis culicivorax TaxID=13658 RepID=A0A915I8W0_ROMCU
MQFKSLEPHFISALDLYSIATPSSSSNIVSLETNLHNEPFSSSRSFFDGHYYGSSDRNDHRRRKRSQEEEMENENESPPFPKMLSEQKGINDNNLVVIDRRNGSQNAAPAIKMTTDENVHRRIKNNPIYPEAIFGPGGQSQEMNNALSQKGTYVGEKNLHNGRETNLHKTKILVERSPNEVDVLEGQMARLSCLVANKGEHEVTWIRRNDKQLLTVQDYRFIGDQRFRLDSYRIMDNQERNVQDMSLVIHDSKINDSGIYECQIATFDSLIGHAISLIVKPNKNQFRKSRGKHQLLMADSAQGPRNEFLTENYETSRKY